MRADVAEDALAAGAPRGARRELADTRAVLARTAQDLATAFHAFYTECRVLSDDIVVSKARLKLCQAAKVTLARALTRSGGDRPFGQPPIPSQSSV